MVWRLRERDERLIIKSIEDILNKRVVDEDIKPDILLNISISSLKVVQYISSFFLSPYLSLS